MFQNKFWFESIFLSVFRLILNGIKSIYKLPVIFYSIFLKKKMFLKTFENFKI